jgi:hypothetical protein
MSTASDLITDIDNHINNYAPDAFHDKWLWNILRRMVAWIASGGTTGPLVSPGLMIVTSADFTTTTDCPIPALDGLNITVLWDDPPKPLIEGTDFTDLAGGGFRVTIPGFDATASTFTFWVFTTT